MRWELLPGTGNVYRFPVELAAKPTADLLRSVAPDVREVSLVAEAFGLDEPPIEIRTRVGPGDGGADRRDDLLAGEREGEESGARGDAETARRACAPNVPRGARGELRSDDAAEKFVSAELEGGYWLKPLKDASDYWAMESARRLIEAYAAAEEALGAERAVGFAMRGEAWRPFDVQEEAEALFFGAARR